MLAVTLIKSQIKAEFNAWRKNNATCQELLCSDTMFCQSITLNTTTSWMNINFSPSVLFILPGAVIL